MLYIFTFWQHVYLCISQFILLTVLATRSGTIPHKRFINDEKQHHCALLYVLNIGHKILHNFRQTVIVTVRRMIQYALFAACRAGCMRMLGRIILCATDASKKIVTVT